MQATSLSRRIFSISALIILLFAGSCQSNTATDHSPMEQNLKMIYTKAPLVDLIAKYLRPYPNELTNMVVRNDSTLYKAMELYDQGNYAQAIDAFPNYSLSPKHMGHIHLYKGISELLAGKQYDAFSTFQRIRSSDAAVFDISNWYLAMNHLVFNNKHDLKLKLEKIIEQNGYGKDKAKALLQDLERLK